MASQVEICNIALLRIGIRDFIANITEQSQEARVLNLIYPEVLDLTLTQVDWAFARQRKAMTLLDTFTTGEWLYRYQLPANCAFARKIEGDARNLPNEALVKWQLESESDGTQKCLLTDRKDAVLVYTRRDLHTGMYPAHFRDLLEWNLAAEAATPLSAKTELIELAIKRQAIARSMCSEIDLNQGIPDDQLPSEFVRVRDGDLSSFRINGIKTENL